MALGIVQSIVIVRILTVAEYGLVNIVMSVGGAFGVYQHLGLASGSTREISSAKDDTEIFKIFTTSFFIRYLVTVPLALILFAFSKYIAVAQYGNEAMILPLRIFSGILLIQGVQSIFNSVISGMRRFKQLFIYQMVIAFVSIFIYIPFIYFYKVDGYFYALALFNLIGSISLGFISLKPLKGKIQMPTKADFKRLLKDILSISLGIYIVKIIYTYWQKSGPLLLGLSITPEEVGIFSFALLYGAKLMTVSDAVTDVNLPVLSKKFVDNISEFKELFAANFDKIFAFIIFAATSAIFWSRELIFVFVGSDKYNASFPLIFPLVLAFIIYSVVNIIKSSIIIPAKMVKEMIISFSLMLVGTVGFYFGASYLGLLGPLPAMAYGMCFGAFIGLVSISAFSKMKLDFTFLNISHLVTFVVGLMVSLINIEAFSLWKVFSYIAFVGIYYWVLLTFGLITKKQVVLLLNSIRSKMKRSND